MADTIHTTQVLLIWQSLSLSHTHTHTHKTKFHPSSTDRCSFSHPGKHTPGKTHVSSSWQRLILFDQQGSLYTLPLPSVFHYPPLFITLSSRPAFSPPSFSSYLIYPHIFSFSSLDLPPLTYPDNWFSSPHIFSMPPSLLLFSIPKTVKNDFLNHGSNVMSSNTIQYNIQNWCLEESCNTISDAPKVGHSVS